MITDTTTLKKLLADLRSDLEKCRNEAHVYVDSLVMDLSSLTSPNPTKLKNLLSQIKSGSKIVDYANFNSYQEKIWLEIWKEATRLLEE